MSRGRCLCSGAAVMLVVGAVFALTLGFVASVVARNVRTTGRTYGYDSTPHSGRSTALVASSDKDGASDALSTLATAVEQTP